MKFALAGVAELKLWLTDLIRIGILELPMRTPTYFDSIMERMVDSKVPGLAGWIKSLKNLPYKDQHIWQDQALEIISKLFLLVRAAEHLNQYSESEQNAIKGLLGWTFNQKELSSNKSTITLKDHWLVIGSHTEKQDDLTIHRYWLVGLEHGKDALIIRFRK